MSDTVRVCRGGSGLVVPGLITQTVENHRCHLADNQIVFRVPRPKGFTYDYGVPELCPCLTDAKLLNFSMGGKGTISQPVGQYQWYQHRYAVDESLQGTARI